MRKILLAAGIVLVFATLPACSSSPDKPATYAVAPEAARQDEKVIRLRPVSDGDTAFTVLGLTTGMPELVGSHADVRPTGRYARVRLLVVNQGRTTALLDNTRQRLLTTDGHDYAPDQNAMLVKRQPQQIDVGAAVRVEFDLWFDVPAGAKVSGMHLFGGPTLTDLTDLKGAYLRFG